MRRRPMLRSNIGTWGRFFVDLDGERCEGGVFHGKSEAGAGVLFDDASEFRLTCGE